MKDTKQHGFSIVELMVALAVSSILLLGLTNIFVSSNKSQTTQTALADIHESGRFALDQIARHVRMTGTRTANWTIGPVPGALVVTDAASDVLTVTYQDPFDCNLNAAPATGFITNVFDVTAGALRCNGVEMIDGIQEMQIFLGEDTDGDRVANRLVPPGSVGLQMNRVVSIDINVLVASNQDRVASNQAVQRNDFWNVSPATDDRRIWREYSTTISIRNPL